MTPPVIRLFLYLHVREFSQNRLEDRVHGVAYVYIRLGLARPPSQQTISYNWRRRFSLWERQAIERAASAIQAVCADHDILAEREPRIHAETVDDTEIADDLIIDAIDRARPHPPRRQYASGPVVVPVVPPPPRRLIDIAADLVRRVKGPVRESR